MHALPICLPQCIIEAMVTSEVLLPFTFSNSFMTFAGEKKCVPMTLSGRLVADAISSMLRKDVLLHRKAEGLQILSSLPKISFLMSMDSKTASTIRSQSAMSCMFIVPLMFPKYSFFCSSDNRRERLKFDSINSIPFFNDSGLMSTMITLIPTCAQHMPMPPPMSPLPIIPTFLIGTGSIVNPSIFEHTSSARSICLRATSAISNVRVFSRLYKEKEHCLG
mmetsp:Transcript_56576/g.101441  ORF Transcript_56576/g.101441 Transcript_56576/m.101441 type:complete len:221 (-) Transcript_56576:39-701(-)